MVFVTGQVALDAFSGPLQNVFNPTRRDAFLARRTHDVLFAFLIAGKEELQCYATDQLLALIVPEKSQR